MDVSEKLRYYRKQNNLTQKELADKLHVSRKTISAWENGRGYPDISSITKLSDIFDISTDDLLRDNNLLKHYAEQDKQGQRAEIVAKISYFLDLILTLIAYGHIFKVLNLDGSIIIPFLIANLILFALSYPTENTSKNKFKVIIVSIVLIAALFINSIIVPLNTELFELLKTNNQAYKLGVISDQLTTIILLSISVTLITCFYPHIRKRKSPATR